MTPHTEDHTWIAALEDFEGTPYGTPIADAELEVPLGTWTAGEPDWTAGSVIHEAGPDAAFMGMRGRDDLIDFQLSNSCGTTVWAYLAWDSGSDRQHLIYIPEAACPHLVGHALAQALDFNTLIGGIHIYADEFTEQHLTDARRAIADGLNLVLGQTSMVMAEDGPCLKVRRVLAPDSDA